MSLFPSASQTNSSQPTRLFGYPVQTSIYGKPMALVYGTNRAPGSVLDVVNFLSHPVKSGGKGGGKGSGGGKFGGGTDNQQYTYTAGVVIGLAQGPITGILSIWQDKTKFTVAISKETYTPTSGHLSYTVSQHSNFLGDMGVTRSDTYSVTANDYGSPGPTTYTGVQNTAMSGHYTQINGVYTFGSGDIGKKMTITYAWVMVSSGATGNPLTDLNLALFVGTQGQTPWTYMTSNFPDRALGYTLLAYLANENMDLGQSGMIPNYSYETMGFSVYGNGVLDALPSDILVDYLTDPNHGVPGWSSGDLGSMTQFRTWCLANGIFVSPVYDSQTDASGNLEDLMTVSNCAPVYSEGVLKVIPYGDKTVVGNGVTYTPNTQPITDLSYDDFLTNGDQSPVTIKRPSIRDAFNSVSVEWCDRYNDYNRVPCEEQSLYHVYQYGLRKDSPISLAMITSLPVAQFVANNRLQRLLFIRNQYTFKLPISFDLLEPMDLVTLTDPNQGLNLTPVRITSITENDQAELEIEAEEFPWGTATSTLHPKQVTSSYTPGYFADPGPVSTPMFFEPSGKATQDSRFHLLIALCGGAEWGGCNVYAGVDGTNYDLIGTQKGPSTTGQLTANLASHASPDTVNTLSVSLLASFGRLASYSSTQANQGVYLLQVDDELIAYETATLTGAYTYNITNLRRGVFGTPIQAHTSGARISFIDTQLFDWLFDQADIGHVRHFKFASFNRFGQQLQSLADCSDYTYTPEGFSGATTVTNVDIQLEPVSQAVLAIATTVDVNVYLPEEDLAVGDEITVLADSGNTHSVIVHVKSGTGDDIDNNGVSVTSVALLPSEEIVVVGV